MYLKNLADSIHKEDNAISGDNNDKLKNMVNWEDHKYYMLSSELMGKLDYYHVSINYSSCH